MHIALVTETFPPDINGVAMTLSRLAAGLVARGHRVTVVRPKPVRDSMAVAGWDEVHVGGFPIPQYPEARIGVPRRGQLRRLWLADPPDLVHIATEGWLGCRARAACEELGLRRITSFHTNFHHYTKHYGVPWLRGTVERYLRWFHGGAMATLTPDRTLMMDLQSIGMENLCYFGRGVDTTLFDPCKRDMDLRRNWSAAEDDPVVIHVSRVAEEKNIGQVIAAFRSWQHAYPGLQLVVVGDGPILGRLRKREPGVIFTGMLTGGELARHYASADMFWFASETETFGNVVLEAMASGLAVLGYDYAAIRQFITDQENGWSVEFGDAGAWQKAAGLMLADREKNVAIRKAAREKATTLPWSGVLDGYEQTLREVTSS